MDLNDYQSAALETSQFGQANSPQTALAPKLGLAAATGEILNLSKRYFQDQLKLNDHRDYLRDKLGDLLWYVAVVAKTFNLDLNEIAESNLEKVKDRYSSRELAPLTFEGNDSPVECFPRRLVVEFRERRHNGRLLASLILSEAVPNAFPGGPIPGPGPDQKLIGFKVGDGIGAELNDNSRRVDDYRYHDAIHMGFMAIIGWSPIMRDLLRIKRKSNPKIDDEQDGARARFLEEGLAAVLYRMSTSRNFSKEHTISGEVIDIVKSLVKDLEVENVHGWLWRRAISQGFNALHQLGENHGGFLIADLDAQTLTYRKGY